MPEKKAPPKANTTKVLKDIFLFFYYAAMRFNIDGCQQRAAALTFTSLLAMVPLLAVSFAIFSAFPAYDSLKTEVQSYLFSNFIPSVGDEVQGYLEKFTAQTGRLTAVGIVFLALSAVMLLMTISNTMNMIWQTKQTRGVVSRLMVFWAVLTLAPMLFGASISLSGYLFAIARASNVESITGNLANLAMVIPFLLQTAGLSVLYLVMPNYPVRRRDALIGGLIAGVMLDLLKRGFGIYITAFPTYETIYGAMATIPIFLIWVYLSWMVVLFGAEVTAGLPEWRHGQRNPRREGLTPLHRLAAALSVLSALQRASADGSPLSERRLARAAKVGPQAQGWATRQLKKLNYIARVDGHKWVLSRDLALVDLATLHEDLGIDLSGRMPRGQLNTNWGQRLSTILKDYSKARDELMRTDLRSLLTPQSTDSEQLPEEEDGPPGESKASFNTKVLALIGLGALSQSG
ncbi:MAG: YihY family inner membrane protein [Alphaproteobacteria bacterium]|nr:YihY family inner membrane protein [Alphaproteobacteria bacterium]